MLSLRFALMLYLGTASSLSAQEMVKVEKENPFQHLLGRRSESLEIKNFLLKLSPATRESKVDETTFIESVESGVSLRFDGASKELAAVFLYAEGADGFKEFKGESPHGLSLKGNRAEVERKIGLPTRSMGGDVTPYWADYSHLGISIDYASESAKDPKSPIHHITISPPDQKNLPPSRITGPRVQFRLLAANGADAEMLKDPGDPAKQKELRVAREVLLDERAVASVAPSLSEAGQLIILLKMTETGAGQLHRVTTENLGRDLAIVLDAEVLVAVRITSSISDHAVVDFGDRPREEVREICGRLHAAVNVLPAEKE